MEKKARQLHQGIILEIDELLTIAGAKYEIRDEG